MTNSYDVDHGLSQDHPGPLEPLEVAKVPAAAVAGGWLPIESAPQTGRTLLPAAPGVSTVVQWVALTDAARDVLAERQRQISTEGWTPEHDDKNTAEQLALAAVCYALPQGDYTIPEPPEFWPWEVAWWKPGDRRRELIKAGALILAEIERLDRAAIAAQQGKGVDHA
ncbi:hypothetical protein D9M72_335260 [compost metagenome]